MTQADTSAAAAPHPNIGPRGCKRRGRMGWVWHAIGVVAIGVLAVREAPVAWYALTAFPFFMGMLGHYQAREQTCVFYAAFDQRDMDGGSERITDPAELSRVRAQARRVWTSALAGTALLTAIALTIGTVVR